MKPTKPPIGFVLSQASKAVARAFDDAMVEAGGSLPVWLVLLSLAPGGERSQSELAQAVGVQGPTLTHHLNGLEADGLIVRARDPGDRRSHQVSLTPEGRARFLHLRQTAERFDVRLRGDLDDAMVDQLRDLLGRLRVNVGGGKP
ncbi:MarR family transcriptional regulator [Caulobacter sp. Root655]|uniref:MarR family winged helix-turn-helix transcriptional regulator n=1 Tax=Caulobacter sp. Root655 TaxID=1736578 RepID=UPI0006FBA333|nr:MarR family winged helix-turn-helix transcriptional regulator [Caulobacter sp. Root655]KRA59586.1 MarR family transcriptional regulator [Caulobacter sp. Root655]